MSRIPPTPSTILSWFGALAACAAASFFVAPASGSTSRPPNIVFILADDMGWRDLACFGSAFYETPRIDLLAAQGMKFTHAYAASHVCSPTRSSIMTGRYPARLHLTNFIYGRRVPENAPILPPNYKRWLDLDEITVPEVLKSVGYVAGSFGKWHMGPFETHGPVQQGFEEGVEPPKRVSSDPKSIKAITDLGLRFMERNRNRPFFLYLPHFAVHIPLEGRPQDVTQFEAKRQPGQPQDNALYAAMIKSFDEGVGRVLEKLDELKLSEHTIVVFTSDNGGLHVQEGPDTPATSNAPLRAGKGWLYEGGHRVPMIVRWPGVVTPGTTCEVPVISVDYFPTLLDIARALPPLGRIIDGVSFASLLKGGPAPKRDALFWHYPHYSNQGGMPGGAVRQGDWKAIEFYHDRHVELYNLRDDPGETNNLAKQRPELAARLRALLDDWRKNVNAQLMAPNPEFDSSKPTNYSPRVR